MENLSQFNLLLLLIADSGVERKKKQGKGKKHTLPLQSLSLCHRLCWVPLARRWEVQVAVLVRDGIFVVFSLLAVSQKKHVMVCVLKCVLSDSPEDRQ